MDRPPEPDLPPLDEVLALYARGYFPMDDPDAAGSALPFYAARERAVLELDEASRTTLHRRVRRSLRVGAAWPLRRNAHFAAVLDGCAQPRAQDDGVWITERLRRLYERLHEAGLAHSFEIEVDGALGAGLVAVLIGRAAMLESMIHWHPHAGNVLLARTVDELAARGYRLCDIQLPTEHTLRLGATLIPHDEYQRRLRTALS